MKLRSLILSALFMFFAYPVSSQVISGKVLFMDDTPFGQVNVSILQLPDSILLAEKKTDVKGEYTFTMPENGDYVLIYSYLGYSSQKRNIAIKRKENLLMSPVLLESNTIDIEAVSVQGKAPAIRQYADKMVVDVAGSVLSEGNNVLELLEKTPGIVSDGKGNFSIQGRAGANVRIDGRDTYLTGVQLASLLRGMQAGDIGKLELMSNPSAREDAAGTAGIINIVTKKNKRVGFGGDIFLRGSRSRRSQGVVGGGIHYKVNNLNMYISASLGRDESSDSTVTVREFSGAGSTFKQRQVESKILDPGRYHSIRTGAAYEFADGGILDASFNWLRGTFISTSLIDMSLNHGASPEYTKTSNSFDETYNNLTWNVSYVNKYQGEDHFLKINFDFAPHGNDYDNSFKTDFFRSSELIRSSGRTNVQDLSNTTFAGRLDYSKPLENLSKLELGWKGTYFFINNDVVNDSLENLDWVRDSGTSNKFQYTQHIEALYAIYSGKFERLEYQAGIRGEYTFLKANQVTLDKINGQQYLDFFPNASALYNLNESHMLRASFSSRIERPGDHDINVFRIYDDAFSYSEGNPDLKPERSYISEFGHGFRNRLFTTLSVAYSRDVINWISRVGSHVGENLTRPENIGKYMNYSATVMYNNTFTSWWTGSHYVNVFYNDYSGTIDNISLDSQGESWTVNSKHTLQFKWGMRSEVGAYYNSGVTTGVRRTDHRYGLDIAAEKKICSDRGMVKLAINGLLRNANPQFTSRYGDLVVLQSAYPDNRKIMLSLSYRFGS